jgi:hypothetical protein
MAWAQNNSQTSPSPFWLMACFLCACAVNLARSRTGAPLSRASHFLAVKIKESPSDWNINFSLTALQPHRSSRVRIYSKFPRTILVTCREKGRVLYLRKAIVTTSGFFFFLHWLQLLAPTAAVSGAFGSENSSSTLPQQLATLGLLPPRSPLRRACPYYCVENAPCWSSSFGDVELHGVLVSSESYHIAELTLCRPSTAVFRSRSRGRRCAASGGHAAENKSRVQFAASRRAHFEDEFPDTFRLRSCCLDIDWITSFETEPILALGHKPPPNFLP